MTTLSDKIKAKLWRSFYKFKFKHKYEQCISNASLFGTYLKEQNDNGIGIGRNYNIHGEQIRGWHRPISKPIKKYVHPLVEKYN